MLRIQALRTGFSNVSGLPIPGAMVRGWEGH